MWTRKTVAISLLALAITLGYGQADEQVPTSPASAEARAYAKARAALDQGDVAIAIRAFSDVVVADNVSKALKANALIHRALAYQQDYQFSRAIDDYTSALGLDVLSDRSRVIALYNRGLAQRRNGNLEAAIDDFTGAIFLDAEFPEAYMSRGLAMREGGRHLLAIRDFEKAVSHQHPRVHLAHYALSLVYEDLGRTQEALSALAAALDARPDFEEASTRLAMLGGRPPASTVLAGNDDRRQNTADQMVTGSSPPQTDRGSELPDAVSPPGTLLALAGIATRRDDGDGSASVSRHAGNAQDAQALVIEAAAADPNERVHATDDTVKPKRGEARVSQDQEDERRVVHLDGWQVQLSAQRNERSAWSVWDDAKRRHAGLFDSYEPMVMRADLGDKGIVYRLRLAGFEGRNAAEELCATLKSRGGACFVAKAN